MKSLARLKPVELNRIWRTEASDFTPWLAEEENIALLGETIGIELEVLGKEESVGPFRADILCKDTATDQMVLIENLNTTKVRVGVSLHVKGRDVEQKYKLLCGMKREIHKQLGFSLVWDPVSANKGSREIRRWKENTDPKDPSKWDVQHRWLMETAEAYRRVFGPIIKDLDLEDDLDDEDAEG